MRIRVAGTIPLIAVSDSLPLTDAADASVVNRCGIRHGGDERDPQRVHDLAILLDLRPLRVSNAAARLGEFLRTVGTLRTRSASVAP